MSTLRLITARLIEIEMSNEAQRELPRYKCHKEVWALKIASIQAARPDGPCHVTAEESEETDGSAMITPTDDRYAPFHVSREYMLKHKPEVGGYYVVYQDGYQSFSPARAFESGYIRI